MPVTSHTIARLTLGRGAMAVNSYPIKTGVGFVLVDTGMRKHRAALLEAIRAQGCGPGLLRLVVITHGDFDHIGNAAHLRAVFGAPVAMHGGDVVMAARGDMFAGRKPGNRLVRMVASVLFRLPGEDRFEPDMLLDETADLSEYGLAGTRVLLLRGHSTGSIALLLDDGSLVSGDVLENRREPRLGSIMDDLPTAEASLRRLETLSVGTVYPGHGVPFEFGELERHPPR